MHRRSYLASVVTLMSVGTAGCLSIFGRNEARLSGVTLINTDDEPHSISLRVERADTIVYNNTHKLGVSENNSDVYVDSWSSKPSHFVVAVRFEKAGNWHKQKVPVSDTEGNCYVVDVIVMNDGDFYTPYTSFSNECGERQ